MVVEHLRGRTPLLLTDGHEVLEELPLQDTGEIKFTSFRSRFNVGVLINIPPKVALSRVSWGHFFFLFFFLGGGVAIIHFSRGPGSVLAPIEVLAAGPKNSCCSSWNPASLASCHNLQLSNTKAFGLRPIASCFPNSLLKKALLLGPPRPAGVYYYYCDRGARKRCPCRLCEMAPFRKGSK